MVTSTAPSPTPAPSPSPVSPGAAGRLALRIDLERCTGCKSCEAACKQEHGLGPGEFRTRVLWLGGGAPDFLPVPCQQCDRPACLRACGVYPKAITKDQTTGVVRVLEDRCTGCGECVAACPYGAMGYDAAGHHAVKCDLCSERRGRGAAPACVTVCPTLALAFGERDGLLAEVQASGRVVRDQDHFLLAPATVYLDPLQRAPYQPEAEPGAPSAAQPGPGAEAPLPLREIGPPPAVMGPLRGGLLAGAARFPFRAARSEREAEQSRAGGCNICFNSCSTRFHFRGKKLVGVTGNEDDPLFRGKVCPKSQLTLQLYDNPHRLTQPLKRIGKRGEGKFAPISWDQALDEIAARLTALRGQWGPEALALFVGTRTGILTMAGYARLFAQLWGTPNVEGTDPFCSAGKNIAYQLTQGARGCGNSFTEGDLGSAELYVYIGDNQAETRPVYFGMIHDWRLRHGARMVAVDPRRSVTAAKADRWLPIRSGTDMALGLALIHHILAEGLHDEPFCEAWVVGWQRWREFMLARGYSPEWAAPITDLPAEEIRRLAKEIAAADGCVILASRGVNQHTNSVQTNRVLMFLAAITGNWGRPGGGYFNTIAGMPAAVTAPPHRIVTPTKPKVRHSPSGWAEAMRSGRPYPIKALIACNNPLSNWPGQQAAREAFTALELLVHIELFPNETSAFADYVLPAATGIEAGDIGRGSDDRRIVWIDKMIEPPGQARADGWIWVELGKRFGFDDVLKPEYADPAVFWDQVFIQNEQMRGCTQQRLHAVPHRWVRLPVASEDAPEQETLYQQGTTAAGAPAGHRFPTPSGKLEFWTEDLEQKFRALGLSALPEFYSEREQRVDLPYVALELGDESPGVVSPFFPTPTWASPGGIVRPSGEAPAGAATHPPAATPAPGAAAGEKQAREPRGEQGGPEAPFSPRPATPGADLRARGYEMELVTGRPPAPHFHSWTHYAWQAQEMWPDLYAQLHPNRARALGIADGDLVRVETAHGAAQARAWLTPGIRPMAVFIPIGWGEKQPFHPWQSVNFLTDPNQRDPISDQTNLKTLLCKVEKV